MDNINVLYKGPRDLHRKVLKAILIKLKGATLNCKLDGYPARVVPASAEEGHLGETCHHHVKAKSGQIVALLKIFLNKGTFDCFVNLSPILTIFNIPVNNDTVHMSHHFSCHGNHFGKNLCVTMDIKLLY